MDGRPYEWVVELIIRGGVEASWVPGSVVCIDRWMEGCGDVNVC